METVMEKQKKHWKEIQKRVREGVTERHGEGKSEREKRVGQTSRERM